MERGCQRNDRTLGGGGRGQGGQKLLEQAEEEVGPLA